MIPEDIAAILAALKPATGGKLGIALFAHKGANGVIRYYVKSNRPEMGGHAQVSFKDYESAAAFRDSLGITRNSSQRLPSPVPAADEEEVKPIREVAIDFLQELSVAICDLLSNGEPTMHERDLQAALHTYLVSTQPEPAAA